MNDRSSYIRLATEAIAVFADDGTMDREELERLMSIALSDGELDDDEKRVLKSIFAKVDPLRVTPDVMQRIEQIRRDMKL